MRNFFRLKWENTFLLILIWFESVVCLDLFINHTALDTVIDNHKTSPCELLDSRLNHGQSNHTEPLQENEAWFTACRQEKFKNITEYLSRMNTKLRERNLTVGIFPAHRPELKFIASAFRKRGAKVRMISKFKTRGDDWRVQDDILVTYAFTPKKFQARVDIGLHTLVVELAYFRGKFKGSTHQSYTWDGVNNRGFHPLGLSDRSASMGKSVKLGKWKAGCSGSVLLLGQLSDDRTQIPIKERYGTISNMWAYVVSKVRAQLNNPIKFKAHPKEVEKVKKYHVPKGTSDVTKKDLMQLIDQAYIVIVASSTAGVYALQRGVPVVALDPGFVAWDCAQHTLEDLRTLSLPDRKECLNRILYGQWSNSEMEKGKALDLILDPAAYKMPQLNISGERRC
mmetsp:Transcript_22754/g.54473  ORF Transcript_22754/g.54473 Transcript_22754/m.54473 type:complete len:396 (+) Transcript_22754:167-1354(+)|eukprot:CAMPEP_0177590734 /NCGR_PEP_ID=MMETSP0419_2-20121207/7586_1 /TAXON_ID=582737 /ORGANISM="Tetraselmis sp., Strain GSL018" /LENGTH=395 /DNA_ID=CAMNT_0019081357 /DNA_START=151 /DNA_END=1341 /DNA_ORIENTATION=-